MKSIELLFTFALTSCSSATPPPTPVVIPQATAHCTDLACIEANEGKVIDFEGTFAFPTDPKRKGQHLYRLNLADGTSVILHAEARKQLTKDRDGQRLTIRGIVYSVKNIPDKYGIFQAMAAPYCVELYDVR